MQIFQLKQYFDYKKHIEEHSLISETKFYLQKREKEKLQRFNRERKIPARVCVQKIEIARYNVGLPLAQFSFLLRKDKPKRDKDAEYITHVALGHCLLQSRMPLKPECNLLFIYILYGL